MHAIIRTRIPTVGASGRFSILLLLCGTVLAPPCHEPATQLSAHTPHAQPRLPERDGQHDFDFEIGAWKTNLKRLVNPLSRSTVWTEYTGTTVVRFVPFRASVLG